jgi:ribonuclease P protein component
MISKQHRYHGYNKLTAVYRRGQTARGPLMTLKHLDNPKRTDYRLAVVVSRKVSKSAVVRNRIRRRIFELYRRRSSYFVRQPDMVVTVFSEQIATLDHASLTRMIDNQLRQAGITKAEPPKK